MAPPIMGLGFRSSRLGFEVLAAAAAAAAAAMAVGGATLESGPPGPSTPSGKAPYGPLAKRPGRREPGAGGGILANSRSLSLSCSKLRPILGPAPRNPGKASQAAEMGVLKGDEDGYILERR